MSQSWLKKLTYRADVRSSLSVYCVIYIYHSLYTLCVLCTLSVYHFLCTVCVLQPVPGKMRLEMVIGIQNEILDSESWSLFSNEPYEKKSVMTIKDFVLYSDEHFESHLLGNGLYHSLCTINLCEHSLCTLCVLWIYSWLFIMSQSWLKELTHRADLRISHIELT